MQALEKFTQRGYIVLRSAVSVATANELRSMARSEGHVWYSDVLSGLLEDNSRVQAAVPDQTARNLSTSLKRFYKTFFREAESADWRFVKTYAGSTDGIARREFLPTTDATQIMNVCAIPGTMVLSTEDNTCVYGYGWNHTVALRSNKKLIRLNKGDILLQRGDFIFSPVGYQQNKVCLHAYLDVPTFERTEAHDPRIVLDFDDTTPRDSMFCFVWNCPFKADGEVKLRKHLNRFHGFRFNDVRRPVAP